MSKKKETYTTLPCGCRPGVEHEACKECMPDNVVKHEWVWLALSILVWVGVIWIIIK